MTTTSGARLTRLLILVLVITAVGQTTRLAYRRYAAIRAATIQAVAIGDLVPGLARMIDRGRIPGMEPQQHRAPCVALIAYLSTCAACEKLAASGAYRDSVRVAGRHIPVIWLGGAHDDGRGAWTQMHGIRNAVSVKESMWRAAGIRVVPTLVLVDSAGRLLGSTSPWPDHVALLEPADLPQLTSCASAL